MITCLGDAEATFEALLAGTVGASELRIGDPGALGVSHGYQIDDGAETSLRASRWLAATVASAARRAGVDAARERTTVLVGTGLRELRSLERWHLDGADLALHEMHFGAAVRSALPDAQEVVTVSNACSASGHALALAADLIELGEADAVVVAGCDSVTESMLTMIGRVGEHTSDRLRPFDASRAGVLLGEGAAAVVVRRDDPGEPAPVVIRGVGLSCDAHHETAPDLGGIVAAMRDAHARAGIRPADVDLVLAHGTGTTLNDPTESLALKEVFGDVGGGPTVTGIKGGIGHTSGGAALMSLLIAVLGLRRGVIPPVVGLTTPVEQARQLRLVIGGPAALRGRIAQVNAFGFGGVNAVAVVEVRS
jgi:3-oxoacyl-[acyl-carrier-protein] synthase II